MHKRIVFLIGYFPFSHGGAELQSFQIASSLKTSHDVYFISICDSVREITCIQENGFTIWLLPKKPLSRRIFRHNEFVYYFTIKRLLMRISPHVVYQRCAGFNTWIVSKFCRKYKYRFVYHCANDLELYPTKGISLRSPLFILEHLLFKRSIKRADKIFVQNQCQYQGFRKLYPSKDIEQVYNFSYVPQVIADKDESPIRILWIANIKPTKNPESYLRIAKSFNGNPHIEFYMIGLPSSDMEEIYTLEKKQINFKYIGYLSNDEVNVLLSKSHLVINTSYAEGFSNVYLQAWFRGCPVVALNADPDNLIQNYRLGFFANGNEAHIIDFLKTYISDCDLRQEYFDRVKLFAFEHLSDTAILPIIIKGILG